MTHDPINVRDGYPVIVELQQSKILSVGLNWLKANKLDKDDKTAMKKLFFKAYVERYGPTHESTIEQEYKGGK